MRFVELSDCWLIEVEDNGAGIEQAQLERLNAQMNGGMDDLDSDPDARNEITALMNIHNRLAIRFGHGSGIKLYNQENSGLLVQLKIAKEGTAHVSDIDCGW